MFRRWMIRGSFISLLLLLVAGWAVSTIRWVRCDYGHDKNGVGCGLDCGKVFFHGRQGGGVSDGWNGFCFPKRFRVVESGFFWYHTSTTVPDRTTWHLCCMGFEYYHSVDGFVSTPPLEVRSVALPFWFLIVVTGGAGGWAWRRTRPKLDPRTAFPVELKGRCHA